MAKRFFDLFLSSIGMFFLLPVFIFVACWIKLDSPGPVFFRQTRVGYKGNPFRIHKFRTMKVQAESEGRLTIGNDSRITRSGQFLRKSKIDELPQLIDVFLGNMSLVGPRPEVQEFIECYPQDIKNKVLSVKPGITDRASIEMVDESDILGQYSDPKKAYIDVILPMKQAYYLQYVDNHTILDDIFIIFVTIKKIIKRT
ncbi:TPA: sugar transferase [Vibrio cholerae]|uniref:sugar transferase n=1 Tax=Vibrio cholerae TaxID=666 RepID=UPI0011D7DF13|nr:sugar transferase [Vibrio cholerae]EGQ8121664.1 sugar transferase [Vibrio cholerae]EGQ9501747.1 sugar transferase [Vibrio cholerae]EGR0569847.1 sugar transferase [Vibrio cholerae]EGR1131874.1 sugar transferase [Vibrio cholerae]EJL6444728.1 sugar transferase [Vibrio cholerae]